MNFVKASLKNRQVTLSVLLIVFAFGVNSLINMPRREDPKITIPGGLIVSYFPGAKAAQVEDQVTRKLEEYLFQFEEVKRDKTYSVTSDGMVVVHLWLQDNVTEPDIFWSKLRHQLLTVRGLDLPEGIKGPFVNSDFGDTESLIIALESDEAGYTQLRKEFSKLEDELRSIPEISKIKVTGEQKEQVVIGFNPRILSQYNLNLLQVIKTIESQNTIGPAGEIKLEDLSTSLYTSGYYTSESDIRNQVVGASKTGAIIRLGDIADISRQYEEPSSRIKVNGHKALMLAVQMHEGKNIVKTGKIIDRKLKEYSRQLPGNIRLTTIANQPEVVNENISEFLREFLLAIISVIIVIMLLLPLNIAAVAATAIPVTISVTIALMHVFGIELHQVSLATLIVVLGMVVDDAVVIADNYVELLDRGNDRWTAAWKSATELVVPVLTATVTIIGSFLPLVILTGAIGEFIRALPLTVTLALSSSFIVAMVLTPVLCYVFIKKGLHSPGQKTRKTYMLDLLQSSYNKSIEWCLKHKGLTVAGSLATIVLAALLFKFGIKQKFFPEAERNQFTVELWMPTGTRLEKTEESLLKIENLLKNDPRVKSWATFTGRSAPRFYYNYSPEIPVSNYGQILINTTDTRATKSLCNELKSKVYSLVPEGSPNVKLMKQGQPENAPVEVRISGNDMRRLKETGDEVKSVLLNARGSEMVRTDFMEDYYGININLKGNASKLGFNTSAISRLVYTCFSGYPFSTLNEGDNQVSILLRITGDNRKSTTDIENLYVQSPVTGTAVPLRQIADLSPEWQTGRIVRRNGVRTLTVLSDTQQGVLASELLRSIKPGLDSLKLPPGFAISYGGEQANKQETYGYMAIALFISLIVIFLVLMFQFRNLKETGLVMLTIPLSIFGAIAGLFITGNEFGFTAFTGLISLSGIVVRNAIILIDHTNELIEKGLSIPEAAYEAGKRRLRPIFLTAMAAAIGVLPMILSGSPLWSPLASVIAFGVVWSMIISTLAIPVMYTVTIRPEDKKDKTLYEKESAS